MLRRYKQNKHDTSEVRLGVDGVSEARELVHAVEPRIQRRVFGLVANRPARGQT